MYKILKNFIDIDKYCLQRLSLPTSNISSGTNFYLENTIENPLKINLKASDTTQESTTGKNLLSIGSSNYDFTLNGIRVQKNENGSFHVSGTSTETTNLYISLASNITLDNKNYVFSAYTIGTVENNTCAIRLMRGEHSFNNNFIALQSGTTRAQLSNNEDGYTFNRFLFYFANGKTFDFDVYIQLEQNTVATTYEEYTGGQPSPSPNYPQDIHVVKGDNTITISNSDDTLEQNYSISLGDTEFCKIVDYADLIFKNVPECEYYDNTLEYGKWYKYGKIGKVVLDGSENVTIFNSDAQKTVFQVGDITNLYKYSDNTSKPILLTTKFISISQADTWFSGNISMRRQDEANLKVYFILEANKTVNDLRNIILDEPLYFLTATPTKTLLSDTLQTQLANIEENAKTYHGITNINQVNDDRPFILDIEYITQNLEV